MKILLISSNRLKEPYPVIPAGLCGIAAMLEKAGYDVKILDLCFINNTEKIIKKTILEYNPEIVGISIRNIDTANGFRPHFLIEEIKVSVTDIVKKYFSKTVIAGGSALGINPLEILNYLDLDYAIYGDGETAFLEFADRIAEKRNLNGVKGLIIRKENNIFDKSEPCFINNLDNLPFASPHKYLDLKNYILYNTSIQVQTKRGCPLKCSYCTYNGIEGYNYRFKSPARVADEIEDIVKNCKIKNIEIVDSIFNLPEDHAKNVLREIAKRKIKLNIFNMVISPKNIDDEFISLLKSSGVSDIGFGVESCSDEILSNLGKNYTKADIISASKLLKKYKIGSVQWFLLLGSEGESYETVMETFKTINKLISMWDIVFIGIGLRVYNGSPISKKLIMQNKDVTGDSFFKPYGYNPEKIDLKTVKILTVIAFFEHHNFFMYDDRVRLPLFFRLIVKFLFPKFPLWKTLIFTKFLFKITGISYIITFILKMIFHKRLSLYKNKK